MWIAMTFAFGRVWSSYLVTTHMRFETSVSQYFFWIRSCLSGWKWPIITPSRPVRNPDQKHRESNLKSLQGAKSNHCFLASDQQIGIIDYRPLPCFEECWQFVGDLLEEQRPLVWNANRANALGDGNIGTSSRVVVHGDWAIQDDQNSSSD